MKYWVQKREGNNEIYFYRKCSSPTIFIECMGAAAAGRIILRVVQILKNIDSY